MRADFWDAYCGRPNHDLLALSGRLHGRVGLAILSNSGDGARREEERRFGFSRLFDPICYSHETGRLKPEPEAYLTALATMDARVGDVLFVDNAPVCVEGARAVGIEAVLHKGNTGTLATIGAWLAAG
jgi:HAD superfamily hydrolase (TIGR01509 family)